MLRNGASVASVASDGHGSGACGHVFGNGSCSLQWAVEGHQALSYLVVGGWVNLTPLHIAKKVIKSFVLSLAGIIRGMMADIGSMVTDAIVHLAIGSWMLLLRSVVSRVSMSWAVSSRGSRVHLRAVVVEGSWGCSSKIM